MTERVKVLPHHYENALRELSKGWDLDYSCLVSQAVREHFGVENVMTGLTSTCYLKGSKWHCVLLDDEGTIAVSRFDGKYWDAVPFEPFEIGLIDE